MTARLVLIEAQRHAGRGRLLRELAQDRRGVLGVPMGEDRDLPHGSTSRAISSSPRMPSEAGTPWASQMNVSRLPFGPGRPEG